MRQVYLAATGMNRGKTTFALGLLAALMDRGLETGFIKPVGQRYALVGDIPADEDAILMRDVFGLPCRVVPDPVAGTPLVLPIGRHRAAAGERPDAGSEAVSGRRAAAQPAA